MINIKKLSFKNLQKLSVQQRLEAIKTPGIGQFLMSALTPTQIAELFPRYYLLNQPDISGFLKALPTGTTAAKQAAFQEQLENTASGDAAGKNMESGGWRRKLQEGVTEQTATPLKPGQVPQSRMTPEQTAIIESLQKGESISINDPKVKFIETMSPQELKDVGLEKYKSEDDKEFYKYVPPVVTDEQVIKRLSERKAVGESSQVTDSRGRVISTASVNISPEERSLLDTIASGEAKTYNTLAGGRTFTSYDSHPTPGPSQAAGRYQFLGSTWRSVTREYNAKNPNSPIKDFSPESQDRAALFLAEKDYAKRTNGRSLMADLKSQDAAITKNIGNLLKTGLGGSGRNTTWQAFQLRSGEHWQKLFESNLERNRGYVESAKKDPITGNYKEEQIIAEKEKAIREINAQRMGTIAEKTQSKETTENKSEVTKGEFPKWVSDRSKRELSALNSGFVTDLLEASKRTGIKFNVTQGMRTAEEAAKNAASGRGVRNSQHLYGAAADIKILDENGNPVGHDRRDLYEKFAKAYEQASKERGGSGRWLGHSATWSHDIWHFDQGIGYGQSHKRDPYGDLKPTVDDIKETYKESSPPGHPFGQKVIEEKEKQQQRINDALKPSPDVAPGERPAPTGLNVPVPIRRESDDERKPIEQKVEQKASEPPTIKKFVKGQGYSTLVDVPNPNYVPPKVEPKSDNKPLESTQQKRIEESLKPSPDVAPGERPAPKGLNSTTEVKPVENKAPDVKPVENKSAPPPAAKPVEQKAPAPASPPPADKPVEQKAATSTAPAPEAKPVENKAPAPPVKTNARGGENETNTSQISAMPIGGLKDDNSLVVDANQKPLFTMNTDKESAIYNPRERKVDVIPKDANIGRTPSMQNDLQSEIDGLRSDLISMRESRQQPGPKDITRGSESHISDRDSNMIETIMDMSRHIFLDPTAARAFSRARFVETGDATNDFHHSGGNSNMKN